MLDFDNRELFDEKGSKLGFHTNDRIDSFNADINLIIGRRANGKSYSTLAFNCIKDFIDSDYKNPALCVNGLAQMAGISEVYLRKIFKMQYGISPSQYITNVRINKAKEFMKYPLLSLEECALQSGFSSLQYFSRVFKKTMGTTPFKYRNKNQKYDSF